MTDRLTTAALLLLTACGTAPSAPQVPDWLHDPHMTVTYSVTPEAVTCSNRPSPMAAQDFPNGWWCHYRCGWNGDHVEQVWLAFHKAPSGAWDPTNVEAYTGRCYSDMECPTCATE